MKVRELILISIESLILRKWSSILLTAGVVVAYSVFFVTSVMYNSSNYYERKVKATIEDDTKVIYNIDIATDNLLDDDYLEKIDKVIDKIGLMDGIEYSGAFYMASVVFDGLDTNELYCTVNEKSDVISLINNNATSRVMYIDFELLQLCGIKYDSDVYRQVSENDKIPIIIGAAYRNVFSIGTELKMNDNTYVIIDILPENQSFVGDAGVFFSSGGLNSLDYCFVIPRINGDWPASYLHSIYYKVSNYENTKTINKNIAGLFEDYSITAATMSLADEYDMLEEEDLNSENEYFELFIYVFCVCIISQVTANIVSIILRKEDWGIYIACGVSLKEIAIIIFGENFIRLAVARVLAAKILYENYIPTLVYANNDILKESLIQTGFLAVLILLFATCVPIAYTLKKQPADFLNDEV